MPRWRPLSRVLATGELSMPAETSKELDYGIPDELKARLEAWRKSNDVITAAELVETAIVEGMEGEAEKAARTLTRPDSNAAPLVRKQATMLLRRLNSDKLDLRTSVNIGDLRKHVHNFPDDPFSWADLALGFVTIGKKNAAHKAMTVALQLAPMDRHILRSAARMYQHYGDPGRAHDLLKRNEATKSDPWLIAAEIAMASLADRKPSFFKVGSAMLDDGDFPPLHVSELASAIGTIHLRDGNRKARKLFGKSLLHPTGNSLAQAEWANPLLGGEIVSSGQIDRVLDSGEARAFHTYWAGDFQSLLAVCEDWAEEEPFSSRPFVFGTFAAITLDEAELATKSARRGLQLDPESLVLRNNLAYGLIAKGELIEGSQLLRQAMLKVKGEISPGYLLATGGMLAIRLGDLEAGIAGYKSAMSVFKREGNRIAEAAAAAFLALEVARAEGAMSNVFIKQAEAMSKDLRYSPEIKIVLDRAKRWEAVVRQRSGEMHTEGFGNAD